MRKNCRLFSFLLLLAVMLCGMRASAQQPQIEVVRTSQHDIFNERGRLTVRIVYSYDINGNVAYRTLYSFDKHGRITRRMQYTDTDYLMLDDNFSYDSHNNIVCRKIKFYDEWEGKSTLKEKRKYKYDKEGNITYRAYYLNGDLYFEDPPRVAAIDTIAAQPTQQALPKESVAPANPTTNDTVSPQQEKKQKNKRSKKKK